jgi:hypothetical protein
MLHITFGISYYISKFCISFMFYSLLLLFSLLSLFYELFTLKEWERYVKKNVFNSSDRTLLSEEFTLIRFRINFRNVYFFVGNIRTEEASTESFLCYFEKDIIFYASFSCLKPSISILWLGFPFTKYLIYYLSVICSFSAIWTIRGVWAYSSNLMSSRLKSLIYILNKLLMSALFKFMSLDFFNFLLSMFIVKF